MILKESITVGLDCFTIWLYNIVIFFRDKQRTIGRYASSTCTLLPQRCQQLVHGQNRSGKNFFFTKVVNDLKQAKIIICLSILLSTYFALNEIPVIWLAWRSQ